MIELRDHGVSVGFYRTMKKENGSDLSIDEYIMLKDRL